LESIIKVSIRALKARLSEYLRKVEAGEEITVTSHGKPVARLLPARARRSPRSAEDEALKALRRHPWIRPGNGKKPRVPEPLIRIEPGEQTLSEIVIEQRGKR
jgi:prevent-host-death family protein